MGSRICLPRCSLHFAFLLASFTNGIVLEMGRKIRAPADEEHGVETYSALYGPARAVLAWVAIIGVTLALALAAAAVAGALTGVAMVLVPAAMGAAFLRNVLCVNSLRRSALSRPDPRVAKKHPS